MLFFLLLAGSAGAQSKLEMKYEVSMENPASKTYQVELNCNGLTNKWYDFKMPVWMPGYYQFLDYASAVKQLVVRDAQGKTINWERANHNTWRFYTNGATAIKVNYDVQTERSFVATNYLNEERGFIAPTGLFMHIDGRINQAVTVAIKPYPGWDKIATGLEKVDGKPFTYFAKDFDILYDSPILIGKLEELPFFEINGVPHYFIGYKIGDFNKVVFMANLKKVLEAAVSVIGEIPFKHYTFIGIGPGNGGIEHLNSTAVAFSGGKGLETEAGRNRILSFLGHEYFHHYNAKRIRPIALGPFNYDAGSRTSMLWVAEGVTTYYDEMFLTWAKLESADDILKTFGKNIAKYENSPGRFFQSVSQASYDTWSDGPFGRTGDEVNKTISYYDKGPIMAMMLDFKIRHETKNKKSLDDVMRTLYFDYYKKLNRGYTDDEFRAVCEQLAGTSLAEFFSYIYTVKTPDYPKYLSYAGLTIDTTSKVIPGAYLGLKAVSKNDTLQIQDVDWESPGWMEGLRRNQQLLNINKQKATLQNLNQISTSFKAGDIVTLEVLKSGKKIEIPVILGTKTTKSFEIKKSPNPSALQAIILKSWLKE